MAEGITIVSEMDLAVVQEEEKVMDEGGAVHEKVSVEVLHEKVSLEQTPEKQPETSGAAAAAFGSPASKFACTLCLDRHKHYQQSWLSDMAHALRHLLGRKCCIDGQQKKLSNGIPPLQPAFHMH